MTLREFRRRLVATGIRYEGNTGQACMLVLVRSWMPRDAAAELHIGQDAVSRALAKLRAVEPRDRCPHCGRGI